MKPGVWILLVALLAGVAAFFITRQSCCGVMADSRDAMSSDGTALPELAWLRSEFEMSDAQFAKVSALHLSYRPTCEVLCRKIMDSQRRIEKIADVGTTVSPELRAALAEHAALRVECQTAMLHHLYQTAACLSPEQAQRYLEAMIPHVIDMPMGSGSSARGH